VIGLYAIALGTREGLPGARGEPLRVIPYDGLQVVCGEPAPALSAEALRAHEAAVRRIAEATEACLPARFGSSAADEESLLKAVASRANDWAEALQLVRGREQMTLRIYGTRPPLTGSAGPGTRYLEARLQAQTVPELEPLRAALSGISRAERIEAYSEPGLIASVYHLIDRGRSVEYLRVVESGRLEPLRATASGPWPAWSFAPELAP
jgi:hypothetical protein